MSNAGSTIQFYIINIYIRNKHSLPLDVNTLLHVDTISVQMQMPYMQHTKMLKNEAVVASILTRVHVGEVPQ